MSGASQAPLSNITAVTSQETLGIRISAEEQEVTVNQNSDKAQIEYRSRITRFKLSIVGLLVLIPKVYLYR